MKLMNMKKVISGVLAVLAATSIAAASMASIPASAAEAEEPTEYVEFNIIQLPDKLVYNIGEVLDLTGSIANAYGSSDSLCWDSFDQCFDFFEVDASEFNNQAAGIYTIYVSCAGITHSFDVEVVETSDDLSTCCDVDDVELIRVRVRV